MDLGRRLVHVPWWQYCRFHEGCSLTADIVVCEQALGELSEYALKYILRISNKILDCAGLKLFIFTSPGLLSMRTMGRIVEEFKKAGFVQIMSGKVWAMTPAGSVLSQFAQSFNEQEPRNGSIAGRVKRKLKKILSTERPRIQRPPILRIENEIPYYNPSGNLDRSSAYEFLPVLQKESPKDYGFLSFIGYRVPKAQDAAEDT